MLGDAGARLKLIAEVKVGKHCKGFSAYVTQGCCCSIPQDGDMVRTPREGPCPFLWLL